jgi:hypothetical protein
MRGRPCRRSDLSSNLTYPILGKGFFSSLLERFHLKVETLLALFDEQFHQAEVAP